MKREDPHSWVIRDKTTKKVVIETFNLDVANAINKTKYEAIPIMDYLVEINGIPKEPQ